MNLGWIKLNRSLLEWEWYGDVNVRILFLHLLITVNYEDKKWRGLLIKKGSRITGRIQLAKESGLSEQNVRTALKKLTLTNELTIKKEPLGSMFTINNWNKYQSLTTSETDEQPDTNQTPTTVQPEANQTSTTTKEANKIKKLITIEERKEEFKNSLHPFLENYDKDLLNKFYSYWTEHGERDKKMRFEKEKSFGISRRLNTWLERQKQFKKENFAPKEKRDAMELLMEKHNLNGNS